MVASVGATTAPFSLDPTDGQSFWVIGRFAREYNNEAGGHPGGSGFGRWGTWITELERDRGSRAFDLG
ncbi:MAG: hypothetical protein IPO59_16240 [Betaproteobacteria bacterium]|nr:hypothetical protein [Betaproteobacteria bacterium]